MKIQLVDVDSKIPNLALMQISAHHKNLGDEVGWNIENPDMVYISCIYTKNSNQARGIAKWWPNAKVLIGGSGINWEWLPKEMQKVKPDYDLYPDMEYSLGFTTRGCVRKCGFCIVPNKEGRHHRWQHVSKFHDDRFKAVIFLDNNGYADQEWFFSNTDYILDSNLKVEYNQGLDIRLLNKKIAKRLSELKLYKSLKFAWDNIKDEKYIIKGIELLKDAGIRLHNSVQFYVLVGFNTTLEEDIYRCQKLKELGTNAYVMRYRRSKELNALARWANAKWAFWSCDFKDYRRKK